MQLTRFTDYGLRSLSYLAVQPNRFSTVREISDHFGISRNHLVKVVHRLAQLGYVSSSKGKGGGIRLAHDPKSIRLGDLVRALETNMTIVECFNSSDTKTKRQECLTQSKQLPRPPVRQDRCSGGLAEVDHGKLAASSPPLSYRSMRTTHHGQNSRALSFHLWSHRGDA